MWWNKSIGIKQLLRNHKRTIVVSLCSGFPASKQLCGPLVLGCWQELLQLSAMFAQQPGARAVVAITVSSIHILMLRVVDRLELDKTVDNHFLQYVTENYVVAIGMLYWSVPSCWSIIGSEWWWQTIMVGDKLMDDNLCSYADWRWMVVCEWWFMNWLMQPNTVDISGRNGWLFMFAEWWFHSMTTKEKQQGIQLFGWLV